MSAENIDEKPEYERFNLFLDAWNKLKATGNFVPSQDEADRIAAMYNVKAPRVQAQHPSPSIPNIPFDQRPIG